MRHFATRRDDPFTGVPCTEADLVPNVPLKEEIDRQCLAVQSRRGAADSTPWREATGATYVLGTGRPELAKAARGRRPWGDAAAARAEKRAKVAQ